MRTVVVAEGEEELGGDGAGAGVGARHGAHGQARQAGLLFGPARAAQLAQQLQGSTQASHSHRRHLGLEVLADGAEGGGVGEQHAQRRRGSLQRASVSELQCTSMPR